MRTLGETGVDIRVTIDEKDNFSRGAVNSLILTAGGRIDRKDQDDLNKSDMRGLTLHELMRRSIRERDQKYPGELRGAELVQYSFRDMNLMGGIASILANVQNKILSTSYLNAATTYQKWTGKGTVKDFKDGTIVSASPFSSLSLNTQGVAPTQITVADRNENVTIGTYASDCLLSRQAMYSDDLKLFLAMGNLLGAAAARAVNTAAYAKLMANAAMSDTYALFEAAHHGNLTTNGGAPSEATISDAVDSMMNQASDGVKSNVGPKFLLVPPKMLVSSKKLITGIYGSDSDKIEVVDDANLSDTTLTGYDPNAWYLAADPSKMGTISVYTLEGFPEPQIIAEESRVSEALGVKFRVVFDFGIGVDHYAGLHKNDGGTD